MWYRIELSWMEDGGTFTRTLHNWKETLSREEEEELVRDLWDEIPHEPDSEKATVRAVPKLPEEIRLSLIEEQQEKIRAAQELLGHLGRDPTPSELARPLKREDYDLLVRRLGMLEDTVYGSAPRSTVGCPVCRYAMRITRSVRTHPHEPPQYRDLLLCLSCGGTARSDPYHGDPHRP